MPTVREKSKRRLGLVGEDKSSKLLPMESGGDLLLIGVAQDWDEE